MSFRVRQVSTVEAVSPDPLLENFSLPLDARSFPLGFPVCIQTNAPEILTAAEESRENFRERFAKPPLRVRIAISESRTGSLPPPVFRGQGRLLAIVSDGANFAQYDLRSGFAFCWVTSATAAPRAWTRYFFIEAIVCATLTHRYVTSAYAPCVVKNGAGVPTYNLQYNYPDDAVRMLNELVTGGGQQ